MLFKVEMEIRLPPDMDPAEADDLKAREREVSQAIQRDGRWPHLWRVPGRYANVSVFDPLSRDRQARVSESVMGRLTVLDDGAGGNTARRLAAPRRQRC